MLLNTNEKPTYNDIRILAGILAVASAVPVHVFRAGPGMFALYSAESRTEAERLAADAGHDQATWLETVSRG